MDEPSQSPWNYPSRSTLRLALLPEGPSKILSNPQFSSRSGTQGAGTANQELSKHPNLPVSAGSESSSHCVLPSPSSSNTVQWSDDSTHSKAPNPYGVIAPPTPPMSTFPIANRGSNGVLQPVVVLSSAATNPPPWNSIASPMTMDAESAPQDQVTTSSGGHQSDQVTITPPGYRQMTPPPDFVYSSQCLCDRRPGTTEHCGVPFPLDPHRTTIPSSYADLDFIQKLDPLALNANRPELDDEFIESFENLSTPILDTYFAFVATATRVLDAFHPEKPEHQQWTELRIELCNLLGLQQNSIPCDFELLEKFKNWENQVRSLKNLWYFIKNEVLRFRKYDWLYCFCMVLGTSWATRPHIVFDRYMPLWIEFKNTISRPLEHNQNWQTLKELDEEMCRVGDRDPLNAHAKKDSSSRIKTKNLGLLHMLIDLLGCRPQEFSNCPRYELLEDARACDLVREIGMWMYTKYIPVQQQNDFEQELRQYIPSLPPLQYYTAKYSGCCPNADSRAHINRARNVQRAGMRQQNNQSNATLSRRIPANDRQMAIAEHHLRKARQNIMSNRTVNSNQTVNFNPTTNSNDVAFGNHNTIDYYAANFNQTANSDQNIIGNQTADGNNTNGNRKVANNYTTNFNQASNNQIANDMSPKSRLLAYARNQIFKGQDN